MRAVQAAMRCSGDTAASSAEAQIAALVLSCVRRRKGARKADGGESGNAAAHENPELRTR